MYRISQLMSTPVASSSGSERRYPGELSPTCVFPSFARDFLDGDTSFECCSVDLLTASHFACRRSPRLLSNGYYTWTEDSFLCDKDGNITLSSPQTSVLYKENLVRIFRKKKRIRRTFSNLFNLSASKSWLHGNIFSDVDSSLSEDTWLEGVKMLDTHHCNEIGGDSDCSLTDAWESEQPNAASSSGHAASQTPRQNSRHRALRSHVMASEHFPENILDHARVNLKEIQRACASTSSLPTADSSCSRTARHQGSVPSGPRNQCVARGLLSSNSAGCVLCHLCVCKMVSGRNISQCLHMLIDGNYCLYCQVLVSRPFQPCQSHHLCSVCQNLTTI
ncbi:transmembrane protein 71 isoform X2 [Ursus maritimus]|uniref:Transmembrane protein 71 isoform X2 n=1 Tax=Ursus maritimus TaxID=29073 RepID=A0A8M1FE59_URSMA|nr:transmembrane protein 71 isoform X2 [Ursus maritimus]XP_040481669.1 transmembrane protein 71 isoform X2 [Ursus maritimus]XP_040481670.1 transmembrane protein 71 isoform X2 [Ursus maritimus]